MTMNDQSSNQASMSLFRCQLEHSRCVQHGGSRRSAPSWSPSPSPHQTYRSPFRELPSINHWWFKPGPILLVVLLAISSVSSITTDPPGHYLRRPLLQSSIVLPSPSAAFPVVSNKRHLSGSFPSSAAEYFYANDKLADDQVAHFVSSLQNQNVSLSGQLPYQRASVAQSSPASSSQSHRVSHLSTSSVFPASHVSRSSLSAQPPSSLFSSSSSHQSHQSQHVPHSHLFQPELSSKPSSDGTNSLSPNLPRQNKPHYNNLPHATSTKNHSTSIRSNPASEFDLSWVQPVYIAKPNLTKDSRLQLNAFKTESIDLNQLEQNSTAPNQTNTFDQSDMSGTSRPESRLESFSAALANVTFSLRDEQWVAPIIALSLLNIMVIVGFECFVIYRACRTCPSRRHLFLGQMLLLGLFLSSVMGIAFVPESNWLSCTMIRAGVGVCYAIVYGTLLVKTVFLLSLHTGVYLSAEYQALLLFFIISTQVAIDGQWLIHRSSSIVIDYMDGYGHAVYKCDHSNNQFFISLVYVMILIVLVVIMAFRVRGYRENHGEAMFIGITATCTVVLWLVWIAGSITSTPHYRDGFIAFGVVGNATLIFIIMFLPKGRQLAAVGREGHLDDRDQLSTASSPSIYTPSFLHIKPMSQLIPLGKPSIAGLGSVVSGGVGGGMGGGPGGYHLYKQFQSTGTTLTSPISITAPAGPLSGNAIPNSYSSHAIFQSNNAKVSQHDEDHNDPNYSNLSTIFATSASTANPNNQQITNHSNLNSPISEINSSSSGAGSSQNSKSSGKSGSKSSQNSKSSATSHQQMIKSPTSNADCFFYLQPPPLPPPSSRPPQPPGGQSHQPSSRAPWRQTCYTPNYHRSHHQSGVGLHHYPKSLAGLANHYHHSGSMASTPMGPAPNGVSSLHHHLLSPSSDNETTSFYFASFDAAGSTTRQLLSNGTGNSASNGTSHNNNHNPNFKYFRGPLY